MAVKIWLDDLRDLAYDLEDILDEFATEALGHKLMADHHVTSSTTSRVGKLIPACFASLSPSFVKFKVSVRLKMNGINRRMEELCKRRIDLELENIAGGSSTTAWQRPPTTCLLTEPAVYGRDEDKAKILQLISINEESNDANFHAVCIVGMAGVGKTTLARLVYNDKAVEDFKFDVKAWVCVSDDFDILRISKTILESITSSPCDLKDLNQVQVQLNKMLSGRKFLVVLDDVWSKSYDLWETLKSPFMAGVPGSMILVTTRSADVALTIEPAGYYDLKLLSDDGCWSVFLKHAFGSRDIGAHRNLKSIHLKVVEKCKGLPLAARTLGGLLRSKRIHEWEHILDSKIWNLSDESEILPVLKLLKPAARMN
ncbi:Disease resistance protein [Melia azedarach]|uniref:Disease resistance protein n=1 Tax=Melia azedarach TaxID=155640 RepID=A0ACC1YNX1_MELAZ|nr:Disease resistance protein [Melia azedarach]